jgi:hypothetical protein
MTVSVSGTYTFTSYSTINTDGYLYTTSFDLSTPTQNLNTYAAGDSQQFSVVVYLFYDISYFLIVTTHDANMVGRFAVIATGPSAVDMSSFTSSTSTPITTTATASE